MKIEFLVFKYFYQVHIKWEKCLRKILKTLNSQYEKI